MRITFLFAFMSAMPLLTLSETSDLVKRQHDEVIDGPSTVESAAIKQAADEKAAKRLRYANLARERQAAIKAEKAKKAKVFALEKAKKEQELAQKMSHWPSEARLAGHPDPVQIAFTPAFVGKHIENNAAAKFGDINHVISGGVTSFENGTSVPSTKAGLQRVTITTSHPVNLNVMERNNAGKFVKTGTEHGLVELSGYHSNGKLVIDHLNNVIPLNSHPGIIPLLPAIPNDFAPLLSRIRA